MLRVDRSSFTTGGSRLQRFRGRIPTGPPAEKIQALRRAYHSRTAVIITPHVIFAGIYWRAGQAPAENERRPIKALNLAVARQRSFMVELSGIFALRSGVAQLGVTPPPALLQIRAALLEVLGLDKHATRCVPHLPLAVRLEQDEMKKMVLALGESKWAHEQFTVAIERLYLMQRCVPLRHYRAKALLLQESMGNLTSSCPQFGRQPALSF